jgi:2-dehydropantoate 2-reductase
MRIAILGVGSIGTVFLGCLADTDAEIVAVSRGQRFDELANGGVILHSPEGSIEVIPPERYEAVDSESGPIPPGLRKSCDAIVISGKSASTPILSQIAEELLGEGGVVMSIQNGMGHAEMISSRVGRGSVLGGTTTHGAWREETGSHWVGRGSIRMGSLDGGPANGSAELLYQYLSEASLNPEWDLDIQRSIWTKLLVNVAINPICSIAGVRNGALLESTYLWDQALSAMSEASSVAQACGVDLGDLDLEELLREVAKSTADNRCSMLQDLMSGRKTEIESICGAIVSKGEDTGIPTPRNSMLLALVKGIESSSQLD